MKPLWLPFGARRVKKGDTGPHYGDVLERAVAACIDLLIIYVLFFQLFMLIKEVLYRHVDHALLDAANKADLASDALALYWQSGLPALWLIFCVLQLAIIGVFLVSMQTMWRMTPGKWLLGLKIVRRHTFAEPETWRYIVRYLGYIPAALPLTIGILWAVFNKERRGWHDMLAGTVVIHTRPDGWYWQQTKRGFRWLKNKAFPKKPDA